MTEGNGKMTEKPLISVVMTTFNEEKYIRQGVLSLVDQADEIIIRDNASTDGTISICQELSSKYPNIDFQVMKEKKRIFPGLLEAFKAVNGKYVHFFGVHDLLATGTLPRLAGVLEQNPDASMAFPKYIHMEEDGTNQKEYIYNSVQELASGKSLERIFASIAILVSQLCTITQSLYRADVFEYAFSIIPSFACDYGIIARAAEKGKILQVKEGTYYRRFFEGKIAKKAVMLRHSKHLIDERFAHLHPQALVCEEMMRLVKSQNSPVVERAMYLENTRRIFQERFNYNDPRTIEMHMEDMHLHYG